MALSKTDRDSSAVVNREYSNVVYRSHPSLRKILHVDHYDSKGRAVYGREFVVKVDAYDGTHHHLDTPDHWVLGDLWFSSYQNLYAYKYGSGEYDNSTTNRMKRGTYIPPIQHPDDQLNLKEPLHFDDDQDQDDSHSEDAADSVLEWSN